MNDGSFCGLLRRCRFATLAVGLALAVTSCESASGDPGTGGETHFLRWCDDSSACGGELECVERVCTLPCDSAAACGVFPGAECVELPAGSVPAPSHCDFRCSADTDCVALSERHRCRGGACRAGDDESACPPGNADASRVLVLGDSFFAAGDQITAALEALARRAGALSPEQRYRDHSSLLGNRLSDDGIAAQFEAALADGPVEVVITNGGGADVLIGSCEPVEPACPVIVDAVAGARRLFQQLAAGGVQHVVYTFYPDPIDAELRAEMDVLRPLIQAECEQSPTPCHWIDLRTAFAGRYDDYVAQDGMNPTAAGAEATAGEIWNVLQAQCLAR